jgi:hypothetical protein
MLLKFFVQRLLNPMKNRRRHGIDAQDFLALEHDEDSVAVVQPLGRTAMLAYAACMHDVIVQVVAQNVEIDREDRLYL